MGPFDRFAARSSTFVSRAPFFAACVLLIVVWAPSYPLWGDGDTWQLVVNTVTTIVTFLLVALLQNAQERFEKAANRKLDAIASFLAGDSSADELRRAVGAEERIAA